MNDHDLAQRIVPFYDPLASAEGTARQASSASTAKARPRRSRDVARRDAAVAAVARDLQRLASRASAASRR
jgi:hypothetical protein